MTRPTFAPDELERSRTQAINGLRVALRQPGPLASQTMARLAYGAAPYGAPVSGTPASLGTLTREEIVGFHRQWWRPDNAALIVTGAMTAEEGFAFAEQALGGWAKPAEALPTVAGSGGRGPGPARRRDRPARLGSGRGQRGRARSASRPIRPGIRWPWPMP